MYIFKRFLIVFFFFMGAFSSFAQQNMDEILKNVEIKIPRLSPIPDEVKDVSSPVFSLNGQWKFKVQNQKMDSISVPGEWEMQGYKVNPGETGYYVKRFDIPKGWRKNLTFVRFDGVSSQATVKINGQEIGKHEGGFVPFEFEITDALKPGENEMIVEVKANTISDILACTSQYAAHTVGGILRKVTLFNLPDINISDIKVETNFDKRYKNADLVIKAKIANQGKQQWPSNVNLQYSLIDNSGTEIKRTQVNLKKSIGLNENVTNIQKIQIKKPKHWNPEQPYLYTLKTEILKGGEILQVNKQKVGFREIEVNEGQLLVNGTSIKLHGVNRHIVHPLTGRSISPKLANLDAKLFKEANCNYIRTSHYPPSEEFLKAADSLGIFVESEAALTWIEHHASPIWKHWDYKDEKFLPYFLMANIENIQAYKNHPSVIIWSLANESKWSPLWEKVKIVVDQLDETRPNSFHDQVWGGFNNAGSKADIANYHYPGINGPKATDTMSRPVLFGEYAHLSTYNRRELLTDPGVRDAYNVPLMTFYDSIYHHKNNLGGAIWSGIDDTFHMPDGRIVGYGPWGPIDGWRRPKPEYYGMKKAYSPIRYENKGVENGKLRLQVENRYDFTNLKDLKIIVEVDGKERSLKENIPPGTKGIISIPVKSNTEKVKWTFYDPTGFIAEQGVLDLQMAHNFDLQSNKKLSIKENEDSYIIQQGALTYVLTKINGLISSVKKYGETILEEGPIFTIVPMNSEDGGKNNIAGETYQRNIQPLQNYPWYAKYSKNFNIVKESDSLFVTTDITFKEGKGKLTYVFHSDGRFETRYKISDISQTVSPYQYGLMMVLPKSFDQLAWKRKGDFSLYPDDHIGRNEGKTKMNATQTTGVEPWRKKPEHSWKDDANELGSNDFRSTKRNIINASLSNDTGVKVSVLSNAKQASRSWLQEEHTHWLIADYSNNGSEPFYGTPHSSGRIKLDNESILQGVLTLIIQ